MRQQDYLTRKTVEARRHAVMDAIQAGGPLTAQVLAMEEQHERARQEAALRALLGPRPRRPDGVPVLATARRVFGGALIRLGARLQGVPLTPPAPSPR